MKKLFLTTCSLLFLAVFCSAQSTTESYEGEKKAKKFVTEERPHSLGLVLSSSNGKGLMYRYWPGRLGVHASFFPAIYKEDRFLNTGITGYMKIKDYGIGTFFIHAGAEYQYRSRINSDYAGYQWFTFKEESVGWNIGAGPGLHIFQKYVSLDVYAGYGAYMKYTTFDDPVRQPINELVVTLSGGLAISLNL